MYNNDPQKHRSDPMYDLLGFAKSLIFLLLKYTAIPASPSPPRRHINAKPSRESHFITGYAIKPSMYSMIPKGYILLSLPRLWAIIDLFRADNEYNTRKTPGINASAGLQVGNRKCKSFTQTKPVKMWTIFLNIDYGMHLWIWTSREIPTPITSIIMMLMYRICFTVTMPNGVKYCFEY